MNLKPIFEVLSLYYPVSMVLLNSQYNTKQYKDPQLIVNPFIRKIPRKLDLWEVRVDIKTPEDMPPETFPYAYALTVYGCLKCVFPKEISKDEILQRKKLLFVNGASVLYSAARDRLLILTSGFPYPPYCLPSFRFDPASVHEGSEKKKLP